MHLLLLAGLILPFAIMLAMILMLCKEMKTFVAEVPVLQNTEQLDRFKQLAARSMYSALLQIALFLVPWPVYIYGISKRVLLQGEITIIFVLSIATFLVILLQKKDEEAARVLPVGDIELRVERDKVAKAWLQGMWPNW